MLVMRAAPAMAEGTASVEHAGEAEKDTTAKSEEALESKVYGEAGSRRETPPQAKARRRVEIPPPEGKQALNEPPPEGWRRPEALPRKGEQNRCAAARELERGQHRGVSEAQQQTQRKREALPQGGRLVTWNPGE